MEHAQILAIGLLMNAFHKFDAELNVIPRDTEAKVNDSTYMNCSTTSLEAEKIQWRHGNNYIYIGSDMLEPYNDRFSVEINSSTGTNNLVIQSVQPSDAGQYECVEDEGFGEQRSAQLIVLDDDPVCKSSMRSSGVIGPNGCGIEPEDVTFSCSITYYGNIFPILQWKARGDKQSIIAGPVNFTSNKNHVTYTLTMISKLDLHNSSFICETTRTSKINYSCSSDVIKILYVFSSKVTVNMTMNDEVSCEANTSQSCSYKWKWISDDDSLKVSNDETLKPNRVGRHRCEATCLIGNKSCTVEAMYVEVYSTLAASEKIWLPLLILLVLPVIVLIVVVIYRRRKMQNLRNGGKSDPHLVQPVEAKLIPVTGLESVESMRRCNSLPPNASPKTDDDSETEKESSGSGDEEDDEDDEEFDLSNVSMEDLFAVLSRIVPRMARKVTVKQVLYLTRVTDKYQNPNQRDQVGRHLASLKFVESFQQYWRDNFEKVVQETCDHVNWYKAYAMLNVMWNMSGMCTTICDRILKVELHLDLLDFLKSKHLKPNLMNDRKPSYIVQGFIAIMHIVVRRASGARESLRACDAVERIQPFRECSNLMISCGSLMFQSYLVTEAEKEKINSGDEVFELLVKLLNAAIKHEWYKGVRFDPIEVLEALNKLAANDNNKHRIVKSGALPYYVDLMGSKWTPREQAEAAQGLWTLAFECKGEINKQPGCIKALKTLLNSSNKHVMKEAIGALWILEEKNEPPPEAETTGGQIGDEDGHVFISYHWDSKATVFEIRDRLKAAGFRVWINEDDKSESVLDTMVKAVEKAAVVAICLSQKYKDSPDCRTEVEYTFHLKKKIIPIRLQTKYYPDGWLGVIVGSKPVLDFSDSSKVQENMKYLLEELGDVGKGIGSFTNDEVKKRIQNISADFVSCVDPDRLSDYLLEKKVITLEEWRIIHNDNSTPRSRCRVLLKHLLSIPHPTAFLIVRESLIKENHYILESIDNQEPGDSVPVNRLVPATNTDVNGSMADQMDVGEEREDLAENEPVSPLVAMPKKKSVTTKRGQHHRFKSFRINLVKDATLKKIHSNKLRNNPETFEKKKVTFEKKNSDPSHFRETLCNAFPSLQGKEFSLWRLACTNASTETKTSLIRLPSEIDNAAALCNYKELNRSCVYIKLQECNQLLDMTSKFKVPSGRDTVSLPNPERPALFDVGGQQPTALNYTGPSFGDILTLEMVQQTRTMDIGYSYQTSYPNPNVKCIGCGYTQA